MTKFLLLILFFALLSLACGRSAASPLAPPATPQFAAGTPELLVWGNPRDRLSFYHPAVEGARHESREWQGEAALTASEPYYVVGDTLIQQTGTQYTNLGGNVSPNGLWVADAGTGYLHLRRADDAGLLRLAQGGGPFDPIWSPDGRWLAYADSTGLWGVDTERLARQQLLPRPNLRPLAWSAENGQLLLHEGQTLIILDVAAQTERPLRNVDTSQIQGQPAWSPDGQTIYAAYGVNERTDYNVPTTDLHRVPLHRLVTIATDGRRNPLRDLLPTGKDRGVVHFLLSPDGQNIAADYVVCRRAQSGLIPFMLTWRCDNSLIVIQTGDGAYATLRQSQTRFALTFAWAEARPPVDFAALPQPPVPIPQLSAEADPTLAPSVTVAPTPPPVVVPFGETAVSDLWALTILGHRRGDDAWALIDATPSNQFTQLPEPPPGYEYLLALVSLRYVGSDETSPIIWRIHFELLDGDGQALEQHTVGALPPPLFDPPNARIPAGETHEGWLVFLAPQEAEVTLRLDRSLFEEALYLALPSGSEGE